jgi:ubiquinone/menaquinone biosynthesis C-methylase UbiE
MEIRAYSKMVKVKGKMKSKVTFTYDKKSTFRPAWIIAKGLPKNTKFIKARFENERKKYPVVAQFYYTYLDDGYFLPINFTKEEMRLYYNVWAKNYDKYIHSKKQNLICANDIIKMLKKYIKKGTLLDLGAGTGVVTELFVKNGFNPVTLVDHSKEMIKIAKKKKSLKDCEFIVNDIKKINLKKKFDLVISTFSLGSTSYFEDSDNSAIYKTIQKHLKKNGILLIIGRINFPKLTEKFKTIKSGIYDLSHKEQFDVDYFIGKLK